MKKLLLTLIAALCIFQVRAYTVDEIVNSGKQVFVTVNAQKNYLGSSYDCAQWPMGAQNNCSFTSMTDDAGVKCLLLNNIYLSELNSYTDGAGSTLTLMLYISDGNQVTLGNLYENEVGGYSGDTYYNRYYRVTFQNAFAFSPHLLANLNSSEMLLAVAIDRETIKNKAITGTISKDAKGNYIVTLDQFRLVKATVANGYYDIYDDLYTGNYIKLITYFLDYGGIYAQSFQTNTTASHTVAQSGESASSYSFPVGVTVSGNDIKIDNFGDLGYAYTVNLLNTGKFTTEYTSFDGTIDYENLTVELRPKEYGLGLTDDGNLYASNICTTFDIDTNMGEGVSGIIDGTLAHKTIHNNWLNTSRQDITVLQNPEMKFEDYYMINACNFSSPIVNDVVMTFSNTTIPLVGVDEIEYTHDCKINVTALGYGLVGGDAEKGNHIYVYGNVESLKNDLFVNPDGYELYIMPAEAGEPDFTHSNFSDENGHVNGTKIDLADYYYHWAPEATHAGVAYANEDPTAKGQALNQGANFCLMVPESDLKVKSDDGKYAVYCAAKYVDGTNLADSFHAYTVLNPGMTGIMDVDSDDIAASITAGEGCITICGSDGNAAVTTASGSVLYQGGDGTVDVAPGMYIVRAGKTVRKVIVR